MDKLTDIKNLDYSEKQQLYSRVFSLGFIPTFEDRIELISAVTLLTARLKEKDKDTKAIDILIKLTQQEKDNSGFYEFLESLSIICEELSKDCKVANIYKYKNYSELTTRIVEILTTWLPF